MYVTAVDPGVHATGVAFFAGGQLAVQLLRAATLEDMIGAIRRFHNTGTDVLVVERPTVYSKNSKGDPDDLIRVAIVAGAVAATIVAETTLRFVEPRTWKGQVPKEIHHSRIRAALYEHERKALVRDCRDIPASLQHNVLDAVGLGLWHLGRLK